MGHCCLIQSHCSIVAPNCATLLDWSASDNVLLCLPHGDVAVLLKDGILDYYDRCFLLKLCGEWWSWFFDIRPVEDVSTEYVRGRDQELLRFHLHVWPCSVEAGYLGVPLPQQPSPQQKLPPFLRVHLLNTCPSIKRQPRTRVGL